MSAPVRRRLQLVSRPITLGVIACALLLLVPSGFGNRAVAQVPEQQIQASIGRAIGFLKGRIANQPDGYLGLATLALLKGGVPADDPVVASALERLASRIDSAGKFKPSAHHNYDAGVTLMALATGNAEKYRRQIEAITDYLIQNQGPDGDWDYPARTSGDTSISQYAILGLWEAARAGVAVPVRVWDKAAAWHISRQIGDGGFAYHPVLAGGGAAGGGSTHTMTAAGTASLHVTRLYLFPGAAEIVEVEEPTPGRKRKGPKFGVLVPATRDGDDAEADLPPLPNRPSDVGYKRVVRMAALDKAIERGKKWISDRYTMDPESTWKLYYCYGIERMTALAGLQEIAGRDWYADGAAVLVAKQGPSGEWQDQSGEVGGTSFGIMFLVKATAKMLQRAPRKRDPKFGGGLLIGGRGLPENLQDLELDQGVAKARKIKGPVDQLLAELEKVDSQQVESAQESLVEKIITEDPEALIGQKDRLLKLTLDPRSEVRRTAYWALGRTNDLRVVPVLIAGLGEANLSCMIEARNGLRYISKRLKELEPPDEPSDEQRKSAIAHWTRWYRTVRPYDERDDLQEGIRGN